MDNEDEEHKSEGEQSDYDVEENKTAANVNRPFHRRRNKYAVLNIATSLDEANYMTDINNARKRRLVFL